MLRIAKVSAVEADRRRARRIVSAEGPAGGGPRPRRAAGGWARVLGGRWGVRGEYVVLCLHGTQWWVEGGSWLIACH